MLSRIDCGMATASPDSPNWMMRPGWGMTTMSGGSPASRARLSSVVASRVPEYLTSMPVRSSKGAKASRKPSASAPVSGPRISTAVPARLISPSASSPSASSAVSSSP